VEPTSSRGNPHAEIGKPVAVEVASRERHPKPIPWFAWTVEAFKQWVGSADVPSAFAMFPKDISHPPRE
jgi:hypothetical protein